MNQVRTLAGGALCALALATPAVAVAQERDGWNFAAAIYGYFPSLSGKTSFPASSSSPSVDVDVDKILDNLEFVFMGTLEAHKGRWGAFTDILYMDVGESGSRSGGLTIGGAGIPVDATASASYDLEALMLTLAGQYRVHSEPGAVVDVFAGARLVDLEQRIDWQVSGNLGSIPANGRAGGSDVSRSNWDGIVGVKGRVMFGPDRRWFVPYYFDIGTGESDLTWQAYAGLGYSWKWGDVLAAWRYIDYDLGSGKPFSELSLNGPAIAVVFRW
jgi:hypothetical protein